MYIPYLSTTKESSCFRGLCSFFFSGGVGLGTSVNLESKIRSSLRKMKEREPCFTGATAAGFVFNCEGKESAPIWTPLPFFAAPRPLPRAGAGFGLAGRPRAGLGWPRWMNAEVEGAS